MYPVQYPVVISFTTEVGENMEELRQLLPTDLADELPTLRGQQVRIIRFNYDRGTGVLLLVEGEGRGAVELGADSEWGDWDGQSLHLETTSYRYHPEFGMVVEEEN